eukprot:scaffold23743_cov44-Cyclotella_meneghiniana.AAC.3
MALLQALLETGSARGLAYYYAKKKEFLSYRTGKYSEVQITDLLGQCFHFQKIKCGGGAD